MATQLVNGKVLVQAEKTDDTTKSGIIISSSKKNTGKYTVIDSASYAYQAGEMFSTELKKGDILVLDPRARLIPANSEDDNLVYIDYWDIISVTRE